MRDMKHLNRRRVLALALLALPRAAQAHAILMDSFPLANGTMPAGPGQIRLRFNSRIDVGRSRLMLVRPDRTEQKLAPQPGASPDTMLADAVLAAGHYQLNWQVLAVDGHITRGVVGFTVVAK